MHELTANSETEAHETEAPSDRSPAPATTRSRPRRHRRSLTAGGVALALVLLAAAIGASWHFASLVVVPGDLNPPTEATVVALGPGRVTLARSEATARPGVYRLSWPAGHAIVTEALGNDDGNTVTRRLGDLHGHLSPGMKVAVDSDVYVGNPKQALGLAFTNVSVPGQLGPMPAWLIPGNSSTWAIVVHGINGDRQGDLYVVPGLHRAGLPALLITYREDAGAPASPDGHHHMGQTEWRDLQAAARYALSHGARRLVLVGASMGGAIVAQFMERSYLAHDVAGLVLDAPALDWKAILSFNATEMGLPSFAAWPVEWMIDLRIDPDWSSLDALDHHASFQLPILLFHGTSDRLVPISTSDAFARELPGRVTYYRVPRAGHVESWNVDPGLYERRLTTFLSHISASSRDQPKPS